MHSTLLLNASYEPLAVLSMRDALKKVINGKATIEDESPFTFNHQNGEFKIPYVIRMTYEIKDHRKKRTPPGYSRRGVLIRDGYVCAYCGKYGDTIDHINPRALGGKDTWENCITACKACNNKKGDRTLAQLGWTLRYNPTVVTSSSYAKMLKHARSDENLLKSWVEYISWYDEGAKQLKEKLLTPSS